ncbi:MAG: DUF3427 domain-containing protein, partial [Verrucomicrobia bacterium]|nr:DUF3427 domain-containing protein [Verrucomicrobiota bacterium]
LNLVREHLRDLLKRRGRVRILTGDYLDITDPQALLELMDLADLVDEGVGGGLELRVFETRTNSFHPKSYLFHFADGTATALVGSSNLTASALRHGIEWNYRVVTPTDAGGIREVQSAFERLFAHPATRPLTHAWIRDYTARRRPMSQPEADITVEPTSKPPAPHLLQDEALTALEQTRRDGNSAGLVVLATGLGKTWLSAFDSSRPEFENILFVAHREEILSQAFGTFRRIRPDASMGRYTGTEKIPDADILFASIQTLGRQRHLRTFAPDRFDYIVIDEFHHAAAATYRNLISHFTPKFLLGLTATPERTDGGDLLALCQENLVYRCDVGRGITENLLAPFHYFGVPDEVDYQNIPWRNNRFDEQELTRAVATQNRAANALDHYRQHGGTRTLAFCCSQRHCDFMADFFSRNGLRSAAVHSGEKSAPRAASLEALEAGTLDILCAVDMFNEGVDLPAVDTVLMLRPTESTILWMQQFGRGLRKTEGKQHLTVIDYIGNHRIFLNKPRTLLALSAGDHILGTALDQLIAGDFALPPGCEVTYDLRAIEILTSLLKRPAHHDALQARYIDFREQHGQRPTATELFHEGFTLDSLRQSHGSWLHFVRAMGDLTPVQQKVLDQAGTFLSELETTSMTRSYKMPTLLAMLDADAFPGSIAIDDLATGFARLVGRSAILRRDVSVPLDNTRALRQLLKNNPVKAWTGDEKAKRPAFFTYEDGRFSTRFTIAPELRTSLQELTRELADWRLAKYLNRTGPEDAPTGSFTCKDSNPVTDPSAPRTAKPWRTYMRAEIPPLFGLKFSTAIWNTGLIATGGSLFLLVTLKKGDLPENHAYEDKFHSPDQFEWKSQNRTTQSSKHGRMLRYHRDQNIPVHLFVRQSKSIESKSAPFYYCGPVNFERWEGEKPITIHWQLTSPVPEHLRTLFLISGA